MNQIKNLCITQSDIHPSSLLQELFLITFCVLVGFWTTGMPLTDKSLNMIITALGGYAGCKMVMSPESRSEYFWAKIGAMAGAGVIGIFLVLLA